MNIDHVVLWVEDAKRALEFYTNVVGLEGVRAEEFAKGPAPFPSVRVSANTILDLTPGVAAQFAAHFTGEAKPTAARALRRRVVARERRDCANEQHADRFAKRRA